MTSPVILFTFVTGLIGSFQVFTAGYVLTAGGPNNESLFYVLYLYLKGWRDFQMGYASAMAWILFLLMLVLTLITILLSRRIVHYEYGGD
jgi:multiple sugar transport system permease protein